MAKQVKASSFHADGRGSNPRGGKDIFSKIFLNLNTWSKFDCEIATVSSKQNKCLHIY